MAQTLFNDEIISSTDLKNNQKKWFDKALKTPISITNTGGRQFVLMNRDQVRNLVLAGKYLELVLKYCEDMRTAKEKGAFTSEAFPWTKYLSQDDRIAFASELVSSLRDITHTNDWAALDEIITSWEATAEAMTNSEFMEVVNSAPDKRKYSPVD